MNIYVFVFTQFQEQDNKYKKICITKKMKELLLKIDYFFFKMTLYENVKKCIDVDTVC